MFKLSIPKPCHENWEQMQPDQQGRFCNACAKTVVDFTAMNDDEVKNYFISNASKKVCGRFTNTQLSSIKINLPENIFILPMPYWKRFLVAALIVFSMNLFSCDTNINYIGKAAATIDTPKKTSVLSEDSIPFLGKVKASETTTLPKKCSQTLGIISMPIETRLMGDTIMMPEDKRINKTKIKNKFINGDVQIIPQKKDTPEIVKGKVAYNTALKTEAIKVGEVKPVIDSCENKSYQ